MNAVSGSPATAYDIIGVSERIMNRFIPLFLLAAASMMAQPAYDLLLKGGHVIDPKNRRDQVMDVAIAGGKIARVEPNIAASQAKKVVNVAGLYVTPGLVDIHVHVYPRLDMGNQRQHAVRPDAFSFRTGVTTMADAGSAGWRDFPDFRDRIIKNAKTRVLAWLNIVGAGMFTGKENDPAQMDAEAAARMAKENPDLIIGFKSAHYAGPAWESVDNAVKAGKLANLPVMVDFGEINKIRNIGVLLGEKLRPGDIYTHCFSGHRDEILDDGKLNPAMWTGRKRGVIFDLGYGAASFYWYVAEPAYRQGFRPDSISTDLHANSMNGGMKDINNVMSEMLALGSPLEEVIAMSTWRPAREIKRPQLGNLDVGADADVAVFRLDRGQYGFPDAVDARLPGKLRIACEMTLRSGVVVWDLNARAGQDWRTYPYVKHNWHQ